MPPVLVSYGKAARGSYFLGGVGGQEGGQREEDRRTGGGGQTLLAVLCPGAKRRTQHLSTFSSQGCRVPQGSAKAESTFTPHESLITL